MNDIDDKILEALNAEDQEVMESYGELSFWGLILESFRSPLKSIVFAVIFFVLCFAVVLVYSAYQFFPSVDVVEKLNWLAVGLTALIVIAFLRFWYFLELVRLSLIREIKRLELQVSLLAKKVRDRE